MNKVIECTFITVASLLFILLIIWGAEKGLQGSEQTECMKWKQQAVDYKDKGFYLTGWQKAQCDHYGIDIEAPVQN